MALLQIKIIENRKVHKGKPPRKVMEILTKDKYEYADIRITEDDPHLWVKTPKGMMNVFVGHNGRLTVTVWSPHDKKVTKRTSRGKMQVTNIEVRN